MEQLTSLLEMGVDSWTSFLIQSILLIGITALILWLIYTILIKITVKRTKLHKDIFLRLQFLWALFILFLLFNVYWFYIIKLNGIHEFKWHSLSFYISISAQIIIYVFIILFFIYNYKKYNSLFKK